MERKKEVPGWYQRLENLCTKHPSELTFKQYYHENEPRMKVLYPFLPLEQIKGKLHDRWKKHHPLELKQFIETTSKKIKKSKFPVAICINSKTNTVNIKEWIKSSQEKNNTYGGRTFEVTHKVPDIISKVHIAEKSILKKKR